MLHLGSNFCTFPLRILQLPRPSTESGADTEQTIKVGARGTLHKLKFSICAVSAPDAPVSLQPAIDKQKIVSVNFDRGKGAEPTSWQ